MFAHQMPSFHHRRLSPRLEPVGVPVPVKAGPADPRSSAGTCWTNTLGAAGSSTAGSDASRLGSPSSTSASTTPRLTTRRHSSARSALPRPDLLWAGDERRSVAGDAMFTLSPSLVAAVRAGVGEAPARNGQERPVV